MMLPTVDHFQLLYLFYHPIKQIISTNKCRERNNLIYTKVNITEVNVPQRKKRKKDQNKRTFIAGISV